MCRVVSGYCHSYSINCKYCVISGPAGSEGEIGMTGATGLYIGLLTLEFESISDLRFRCLHIDVNVYNSIFLFFHVRAR